MDVRAAVAWEKGKPLSIETVHDAFDLMAGGESIRSVIVY